MSATNPPTFEDLLALGWRDEPSCGAYCKIAVSNTAKAPDIIYVGLLVGNEPAGYPWGGWMLAGRGMRETLRIRMRESCVSLFRM